MLQVHKGVQKTLQRLRARLQRVEHRRERAEVVVGQLTTAQAGREPQAYTLLVWLAARATCSGIVLGLEASHSQPMHKSGQLAQVEGEQVEREAHGQALVAYPVHASNIGQT